MFGLDIVCSLREENKRICIHKKILTTEITLSKYMRLESLTSQQLLEVKE